MQTSTDTMQAGLKRACRSSYEDLSAVKRAACHCPAVPNQERCPHQSQDADAARTERQREITAWDSQSKIWLTYRALRELDQRNWEAFRAHKADRPFKGLFALRRPPSIDGSCRQQPPLADLQRFARGGGPDLRALRGVSYPAPAI